MKFIFILKRIARSVVCINIPSTNGFDNRHTKFINKGNYNSMADDNMQAYHNARNVFM